MGIQRHLDVRFFCPLSGCELDGRVVPAHQMNVMQCENGSLFAKCTSHLSRCFVSDHTTVQKVMNKAVVIRITQKNGNRKGNSDGERA